MGIGCRTANAIGQVTFHCHWVALALQVAHNILSEREKDHKVYQIGLSILDKLLSLKPLLSVAYC